MREELLVTGFQVADGGAELHAAQGHGGPWRRRRAFSFCGVSSQCDAVAGVLGGMVGDKSKLCRKVLICGQNGLFVHNADTMG
jgi:hypothetical protein